MKRLVALMMCAVSIGILPDSLLAQDSQSCSGIELMQTDLVVSCDDEVLLQSLTGPVLWNQDLFSDSLLVTSSGPVEVQEAALDLSQVTLGEGFGYLNLGSGFNNLSFPLTMVARFSIPEGQNNFHLFATDEGLGYSGISLTFTTQGWFETFIGDGSGGGPGQRRSKKSYCSLSTDTWYTVVAVIRGATDHTVYLDGVELGGDYSGSGNGQIVDLGRPATIGYHVPDSGPQYGQQSSSTMKFDFFGVYDSELQSSDIVYAGCSDSDNASALVRPSGAVGWYDFDEEDPFADSEGNQAPMLVVGDVQADLAYCLCPGIEQVEVQLLDCEFAEFFCGEGTTWDVASQTCIVANPSDSNFDGCVQLNDLLDLLSAYGNCGAEESTWQCGDPLGYQGHDYSTVQIGEQCWFAENLQAEQYLNGDSIEIWQNEAQWMSADFGMMGVLGQSDSCFGAYGIHILCPNPDDWLVEHGRLYNWYAVDDERGLCPSGWHVPSSYEFLALTDELGGAEVAGVMLKSVDGWIEGGNGTNSVGFNAKPSGGIVAYEPNFGTSQNPGVTTAFWTSTMQTNASAYTRGMIFNVDYVTDFSRVFNEGQSVRCIKD